MEPLLGAAHMAETTSWADEEDRAASPIMEGGLSRGSVFSQEDL